MTIEFFVEAYFCLEVFRSGVLLYNFGSGLEPESVKEYWSGAGVLKLATPLRCTVEHKRCSEWHVHFTKAKEEFSSFNKVYDE